MSLFSTREWWSTSLISSSLSSSVSLNKDTEEDNDTEFDAGCIATGNLDADSMETDKSDYSDQYIVVGNLSGMIRVYYPRKDIRHKVQNALPSLKESKETEDQSGEVKTNDFTSSEELASYSSSSLSYTAEDLLLEEDLPHPILQVGIGNFIANSSSSGPSMLNKDTTIYQRGLAILHPHKLAQNY